MTERQQAAPAKDPDRIRRLLDRTEEIAGIGSFEWDPDSDELVCSDNLFRIVGLAPNGVQPTVQDALRRTHPEDRERVAALLERARLADEPVATDLRIVRPDGTVAHLHIPTTVQESEAEGRRRLIGFVQDVSVRRWPAKNRAGLRSTPLTARERQVLQLAAAGQSTRGVADRLFLSPGTVKTHFQHIYAKLGVSDRAAAVAHALRSGVID
jgi:ATP/maltotriose-dependent transcriptional regulator MalT